MSVPETVLVIAAHPDDETFGCGATLRRHVEAGARVHVMTLTDGVGSRRTASPAASEDRAAAAEAAAEVLGVRWHERASFPDNALDTVPLLDLVRIVEAAVSKVRPSLVYTHHWADLNVDHRLTQRAALTALRPLPGAACREIRTFEVSSSTEWSDASLGPPFIPNLYVDVTRYAELKRRALLAYDAELRPFPHARSLQAIDAMLTMCGAQDWSHIVPKAIVDEFECVCFHATPVSYGRGGSPIQNMIARGHESTRLTALRMVAEIDAGPIYMRIARLTVD